MAAKISLIVPVYNVETYLPRCLKSVEDQTLLSEMEILLIDDGSTDSSDMLCDQFAKKHANVRVVHKENGGVSSARNTALDLATGDYIAFLDSDDYIHAQAMERFYTQAIESGADIVSCRYAYFSEEGAPTARTKATEPLFIEGSENILRSLINHTHGMIESIWNKLFRREILNGLHCPTDICCGEDAVLLAHACTRAKTAYMIPDLLYFYFHSRIGSIMHSESAFVLFQRASAHDKIACIAQEHFPELTIDAWARANFMRMHVINLMLVDASYRNDVYWPKHFHALRKCLPKILTTRSHWISFPRKAYAVMLAYCPSIAAVFYKRRAKKRKKS